eukprot:TRINITY_DN25419_c0_g2_i1.p1 TRINITY_DN25419_c0_g2~~TRINITY_DN25419_c0_g2_i1.p1  ORF type:complete len:175 (+),score=35.57 TRINITY_DN25419_c0_g2_i1:80-604(+)
MPQPCCAAAALLRVRPQRHSVLGATLLLATVAALAASAWPFSVSASAAAQPVRWALRVCEKCTSRKAGNGYNPMAVLRETARSAKEAGWPAPVVEYGKCTGACDYGPTVRLVKGEIAIPTLVEGMTKIEVDYKAFLSVQSDEQAERAFGLSSRQVMNMQSEQSDEQAEPADIPA